jgi:uncharacterized protein
MTNTWRDAIEREDLDSLGRQLDEGVNVDVRDKYGQTALMLAARDGRAAVVRFLVSRGAALDVSAKYHLTALMLAVIRSHADVVKVLLDAGADTTLKGSGAPGFYEKTALDLAEGINDASIVALLRTKGSSPSA